MRTEGASAFFCKSSDWSWVLIGAAFGRSLAVIETRIRGLLESIGYSRDVGRFAGLGRDLVNAKRKATPWELLIIAILGNAASRSIVLESTALLMCPVARYNFSRVPMT